MHSLQNGFASNQVIPTLVTMCKPGRSAMERIEGAEMIAYLSEVDVELQKKTSITDHCIPVIANYFRNINSSSPSYTKVIIYRQNMGDHMVSRHQCLLVLHESYPVGNAQLVLHVSDCTS